MNMKNIFFFLILLMTFLLPVNAGAFVWTQDVAPIPAAALTDGGSKVRICHRKGNGGYVVINISINGLNGHSKHKASGKKLADEFYINGKCDGSTEEPEICADNQILNNQNNKCENCPAGSVADNTGEACITPPPSCTGGQILNAAENGCVCPIGQSLVNNVCVLPCPAGQSLVGGVCTTTCPAGQSLVNGVCTTTITCPSGQSLVNGACSCPVGQQLEDDECEEMPTSESFVPTVNPLKTSTARPVITGSAGESTTLTISLAKKSTSNASYNVVVEATPVSITENGFWAFTPAIDLKPGIYDVIATGNTGVDASKDELEIAIDICNKSQTPSDQMISISEWDVNQESPSYYLGKCTPSSDAKPLPHDPQAKCVNPNVGEECIPLPSDPTAKAYENITSEVQTCDDGGKKYANEQLTGLTVKRVRLANATTSQSLDLSSPLDVNPDGSQSKLKIKYGVKLAGGQMDISNATITGGNQAMPVKLTNVTLADVFIDTAVDYIDSSGNLKATGSYISVKGGNTTGTITGGMITAGTDGANNPVRGSVATGIYQGAIANDVLTKGRRIRGTLTNAVIENARTTSVNGETRLDAGDIVSGTITNAQVFGTVLNATLTNVTISKVNHCFSSGTVGQRGQLNWKEVVK